jgi:hypothetical protein
MISGHLNEIVIFSDLPLLIQKKNYILDIFKEEDL